MDAPTKFFIIVLYNCPLARSASFVSINTALEDAKEVAHLYVYDNSPEGQIIQDIPNVWITFQYIHDPANSGLGVAYNSGAKIARQMQLQWIVLLDQDTVFPPNYIRSINAALSSFSSIQLFAPKLQLKNGNPMSPAKFVWKRGYPVKLREGIISLHTFMPVNSGLVVNVQAYHEVGGYIEKVKLDFADFQFIERFRKKYGFFYLLDAVAIQDFSHDERDVTKSAMRFKIFLECARNCVRYSFLDEVQYFYVVVRHLAALTLKHRSFTFIKMFFTRYINSKA